MAERRRAALARGAEQKAREIDPFAGQSVQSRLEELGIPTVGGCATEAGTLRRTTALRSHRRLESRDFRMVDPGEPLARRAVQPAVFVSCTLELLDENAPGGGFEVHVRSARFAAFFDAPQSWLHPEWRANATVLEHAQAHFDLAHLLAREADRTRHGWRLVGRGETPAAAREDFALRWSHLLGRLQTELRQLESQLDRETAHGQDRIAQAQWTRRITAGLPALRAP